MAKIYIQITVFLVLSIAFSVIVIRDFSIPLIGSGDINLWEYIGFYLTKNLKFDFFPQLDLISNQVFYPYGVNSVFQSWGFERDFFYAILSSIFGRGAWLQFYYLLTILFTAFCTFALLNKDYGFARASGAGVIVSFFNSYGIFSYPHHLNIAVFHWTTLSIICDFLIVKKITFRQKISLRFFLLRGCLLILSLSQDLGYIAGFALMSLTVSILLITLLMGYRYLRGQFRLKRAVQNIRETYQQEVKAHPRQFMLLLIIGMGAAYLYLPLTIQIFKTAKSFDVTSIPTEDRWSNASAWIHPLRLFIPYFAFFLPAKLEFIQRLLQDYPERFGAGIPLGSGSPGLFLVIIGIIGLYQARSKIFIYLPLITILALCLFYHPDNLPLLKIFPWFSFNRITDRSSIIYPCIFVLFSLNFNPYVIRLPWRNLMIFLLVCLACAELYTTYSVRANYIFKHNQERPSQTFFDYMDYLKNQPGEAVLDWPFCVEGANYWEITQKLCPYYKINNSIYTLRRFHQKKVMGKYFGRLYPEQVQTYLKAGWDKMFVPQGDKFITFGLDVAYKKAEQAGYEGSRSSFRKALQRGDIIYEIWSLPAGYGGYTEGKIKGVDKERESHYTEPKNINKRCFQEAHWSFFSDFYKYNDFAGINLYIDVLPEECIREFYQRFGNPIMETVIPKTGRVQFIPKSSELRKQVNQDLGIQLKFEDY